MAGHPMPKPLLRALLRPWIRREVYECLTLDRQSACRLGLPAPAAPSGTQIRAIERTELDRLSAVPQYSISRRFLVGIAARADRGFGAFVDGELASYAFFAPQSPTAIDESLRFEFAAGWTYVYKCFTLPRWRGQRLLPLVLASAMAELTDSGARSTRGFVTLVVRGNQASRKSLERCGFEPRLDFPVWRVLSRPCHIGAGEERRNGPFLIDVASAQLS